MIKSLSFNLRPHHSLCIQFFVGHGYSSEFVSEMTKTIRILNTENPLLTLTNGCDVICEYCPNNIDGICNSECKVGRIDRRCLESYGLDFGDKLFWLDLKALAREKIISQNKIPDICLDCQWRSLCGK